MEEPLISVEDLKKVFGLLGASKKYIDYTPLKDSAGFSVQREYPSTIRYKPPVSKEGIPDTVALIHVVFLHPFESEKKPDLNEIPLLIRITTHSRYLNNHWDYNFIDDEKSPTQESLQESNRTPKPISLESNDEYYYNKSDQTLRTKEGVIIPGEKILDNLFEEHCNTIHLILGLKLQWKIGSHKLFVKILDVVIRLSILCLKYLTGRTLDSKDPYVGSLMPYDKENMRLLSTEKINVFNYEASKNTIITFCILVFLCHWALFIVQFKSGFMDSIMLNNTVLIATLVILVWLLDQILPILILGFVNVLIKLKSKLMFKKFKV